MVRGCCGDEDEVLHRVQSPNAVRCGEGHSLCAWREASTTGANLRAMRAPLEHEQNESTGTPHRAPAKPASLMPELLPRGRTARTLPHVRSHLRDARRLDRRLERKAQPVLEPQRARGPRPRVPPQRHRDQKARARPHGSNFFGRFFSGGIAEKTPKEDFRHQEDGSKCAYGCTTRGRASSGKNTSHGGRFARPGPFDRGRRDLSIDPIKKNVHRRPLGRRRRPNFCTAKPPFSPYHQPWTTQKSVLSASPRMGRTAGEMRAAGEDFFAENA